ncbi:phosphotransferase family protein [Bradyrhizobium liaoningense]|uniref:phosphotransferase family protein n=1 Tax=Bradyrhizobium liaoningense TaxID=43992 RepID=UPI0020135B43|nr:aminoglycoside phosphotransferase family protein [Bradyrhizobium liaoningense]
MAPPRRLTFDLDLDRVRAIVRDLDTTLDPVKISRLHGGSTEVYRIDLEGGADPLVLKIYDDEPAWAPAKEALVAGLIPNEVGVTIPRWLRVDERRLHMPLRFALMTWLPGETVRTLMATLDVTQVYHQMGEVLRRVHCIPMSAYGYIGTDGVIAPEPTNDTYMRRAFASAFRQFRDQCGDANLARRLEIEAQSRFGLLACSAGPVLCHDDFHQGNVLAMGNAADNFQVSGLVDFGNARAGDALFDLAKALMCSTHEDPRSPEALVAGYGKIDHPDPVEAIWLYTLFHRVSMYDWLRRIGDDPASIGPSGLLRDLAEMIR